MIARVLILIGILIGPSLTPVLALASPRSVGIDLRDLNRWAPDQLPYLNVVVQEMKKNPTQFFPRGVQFSDKGVRSATPADQIYGVYLAKEPTVFGTETANTLLFAIVQSQSMGSFVRFFDVEIGLAEKKIRKITLVRDVALAQTRFRVDVALLQRKAIIKEESLGIQIVYPLGVGGFDEAVENTSIKLKTPRFRNAALKRDNPIKFDHPFISIHSNNGTRRTPFGLHAEPGPQFSRGFLSHGCLRVRLKDLYELNLLINDQGAELVKLDVHYRLDGTPIHPFPVLNDRFQAVVNCGSELNPKTCKDEENLTKMRGKRGRPPVDLLSSL